MAEEDMASLARGMRRGSAGTDPPEHAVTVGACLAVGGQDSGTYRCDPAIGRVGASSGPRR